jgi:hypothetical protein
VDDAVDGEEELVAQLVADPTLPAVWAAMTEEAEVLPQPVRYICMTLEGKVLHDCVLMAPAEHVLCCDQGRGVLDLPLSWVEPDLRRYVKREATKLSKLWRYTLSCVPGCAGD